jgi:succinate dehydrogenase (ubiquinone) cytochrome b560 subunit
MYGYFLAYLAVPGTFDSAHVLEVISGLPEAVKYSTKVILAAPFAFHTFNGIRHLGWDVGKCAFASSMLRVITDFVTVLALKSSYQAGYVVLAATAVSTVALVLI